MGLATRLGIPLLFGIDAVHGNAKVAGATVFPHGIALGCTGDTALVTEIEQATAAEVLATGFTMSFSPDSDVGQDERWGRTYEGEGVAGVLYGDAVFSGTLSKSWPRDATTLPISSLQPGADPLFAYGFGLRYP